MRLSYLPKRTAFGFEAMEARGLVVLLDHNFHLNRQYLRQSDGLPLLHRSFNVKSRTECVRPRKEKKQYAYIAPLLTLSEHFAIHGTPADLLGASFDPQTLARTTRGPHFKQTSSADLLTKHMSRF